MYLISKEVEFDAAHRLYGYKGLCSNLHGHRWKVIVEFEHSCLNGLGMVVDFKDIKSGLMDGVINVLDHACLLSIHDTKFVKFLREQDQRVVTFDVNPTAEAIAAFIGSIVYPLVCTPTRSSRVTVYETPTSCVVWTPGKG